MSPKLLLRNTSVIMELSADDIMERIMAKAIDEVPSSANPMRRFHVSQTAEQLPDIRLRNAIYRAELERQIEEKREKDKKRRIFEAEEEDRLARKIEEEREKIRQEFHEETERRKIQQEEVKRRQAAIVQRLAEIQEEAERKRQEEANKRKRMYLDHLYVPQTSKSTASLAAYYRTKPWNSRDYVHAALHQSLEEIYKTAPLHLLADVYKKLEYEKTKMRDIIRRRISEGERD